MRLLWLFSFVVPAIAASTAVLAHPGEGAFFSGLVHPALGLDHLLVATAVGMWAARFPVRLRWTLPAAFVGFMLMGALLGAGGARLPAVEPIIAASVFALGLLVAMVIQLPLAAGAAIVATFALFHGQAHFADFPSGASVAAFGAGVLIATALLHVAGIVLAAHAARQRAWLPRALGGAMAAAGAWMMFA